MAYIQFRNNDDFNTYLSERLIDYDIKMYFNVYFNTFNLPLDTSLDILFMDYFLNIISKKNEFCIDHEKLIEYGIINNTNYHDIENCIDFFDFKKNIDYEVSIGKQLINQNKVNINYYKMKPHVFKICLMRSHIKNRYAKLYMELEECHTYYKDYKLKYQTVLLFGKNNHIDELNNKIEKESKRIKKLEKHTNNIEENNKILAIGITKINEKLEKAEEEIVSMLDNYYRYC